MNASRQTSGERISAADMLSRLIGFDTTSANSNLALIEAVADYLEGHGIASRLIRNEAGDKANLFATIGPARDGGLVLSGHTDVVPVAGQDWSSDPFAAATRDGRIYGRGSCDMKGFIACCLALAPEMIAARLKTPIHFAFSYDEEVGCAGVPGLLAEIANSLPQPAMAIIGEPTSMQLVNSHKGIYAFETVLTGLEAHSSATHIGVSAILHGAEFIAFLASLADEMREKGPLLEAFDPPYTTFNIGQIDGGTAVNIIPRECRIIWEFRPVPGLDPARLKARIAAYAEDELRPRMRARFPGAEVTTTEFAGAPPLVPQDGSPAEALVRRLTGANRAGTVAFATEAGQFAEKDMSAVVIGPGSIDQAHKPGEYVDLSQLASCEDFLKKLIAWAAETAPGE
jgi:acetylornithine deacetylase